MKSLFTIGLTFVLLVGITNAHPTRPDGVANENQDYYIDTKEPQKFKKDMIFYEIE